VRVGDIAITASGSGNLLPAREAKLGFRSGGVLADLAVEVGDTVAADALLARLDDADAKAQVAQASASVRLAELKLAALTRDADPVALATTSASLAAAQADLSKLLTPASEAEILAAQENLRSAREALAQLQAGPDPDKVRIAQANVTLAEINVRAAQAAYDRVAARGDPGASKEAAELWQATTNLEKAQAEMEALQDQIVAALTQGQVAAIAAMRVTNADLQAYYVEIGVGEMTTPEPGVTPQGGALKDLPPEQREAARATAQALGTPVGNRGGSNGATKRDALMVCVLSSGVKRAYLPCSSGRIVSV